MIKLMKAARMNKRHKDGAKLREAYEIIGTDPDPLREAQSAYEITDYLDKWFNQGVNEMQALQVKGTDEFREPTENDVVWKDQIIGSDPDPEVRLALLREAQAGDGDSG